MVGYLRTHIHSRQRILNLPITRVSYLHCSNLKLPFLFFSVFVGKGVCQSAPE